MLKLLPWVRGCYNENFSRDRIGICQKSVILKRNLTGNMELLIYYISKWWWWAWGLKEDLHRGNLQRFSIAYGVSIGKEQARSWICCYHIWLNCAVQGKHSSLCLVMVTWLYPAVCLHQRVGSRPQVSSDAYSFEAFFSGSSQVWVIFFNLYKLFFIYLTHTTFKKLE